MAEASIRSGPNPFLPNLQVLRFVAAAMVLLSHLLLEVNTPRLGGAGSAVDPTAIPFKAGVDIFFLVSGFIMYHLAADHFGERGYPGEFLKRRLVRVAPLYWLVTLLLIGTIVAQPSEVNHSDLTWQRIVTSFLFIPWPRAGGGLFPIMGLGWTLNYEMFFYAAFAIALFLRRPLGLALIFGGFVALVVLGKLAHLPEIMRFWCDPIILEFLGGILLAMAYRRGWLLPLPVRIASVVAGVLLFSWVGHLGVVDKIDREIWGGAPALLVAVGFILAPQGQKRGPLMAALLLGGDASYSLYLSHMFSVRILTLAWLHLHLPTGAGYVAAGMAVGAAGAVATYLWAERPLLRTLRARFEPRRAILAS